MCVFTLNICDINNNRMDALSNECFLTLIAKNKKNKK